MNKHNEMSAGVDTKILIFIVIFLGVNCLKSFSWNTQVCLQYLCVADLLVWFTITAVPLKSNTFKNKLNIRGLLFK